MVSPKKSLLFIGASAIGLPVLILMLGFFPMYYNQHLTDLGRFSKTVRIGMPEDATTLKIKNFQEHHRATTELVFGYYEYDLYGNSVSKSRVASLIQKSLFEDVQFRVMFKEGKVYQKILVSD